MIQRVQSILLLISAVAMGLMLFFPIWQKVSFDTPEEATLDAFHLTYDVFNKTTDLNKVSLKIHSILPYWEVYLH